MTIYLLGKDDDNEINNLAIKTIISTEGITPRICCTETNLDCDNKNNLSQPSTSLNICTKSFLDSSPHPYSIILFKSSFNQNLKVEIPDNATCIIDPSNNYSINALSSSRCTAITCGTSSRDTFSLASLTPGRAVVSIQRNIMTLDSKLIESKDIIIKLSQHYKTYSILSVCALINLIGTNNKHKGKFVF